VTVAEYVPLPLFVTEPIESPPSLEEKATVSPVTAWPSASVTVAVAVEVDVPLATIELGESETLTLVAGPGVCVSVACPDTLGETELSVAVIVACRTVVELVTVAEYVPLPLSVTGPIDTPPSVDEKATCSPGTKSPPASVMVAVAVVVELPFATITEGESATATLAALPTVWFSVACPDTLGETELSVAVIVTWWTVVELVTVAE
jgi:hypothetical protein